MNPLNWQRAQVSLPRPGHPLRRDLTVGMRHRTGGILHGIRGDEPALKWGLHTPAPPAQRSASVFSLGSKNLDNNRPDPGGVFHLSITAHLEILTVKACLWDTEGFKGTGYRRCLGFPIWECGLMATIMTACRTGVISPGHSWGGGHHHLLPAPGEFQMTRKGWGTGNSDHEDGP